MNKARGKKRAGLTLIEVLVALSILSIMVIALSGLMTSSLQARQVSVERSTANRYIESVLNRYKSTWTREVDYNSAANPPNIPPVPAGFDTDIGLDLSPYNADGTDYNDDTATGPPAIRRVQISLSKQGEVVASMATEIARPVVKK